MNALRGARLEPIVNTCGAPAKGGICGRPATRGNTCGLHAPAERERRTRSASAQWEGKRQEVLGELLPEDGDDVLQRVREALRENGWSKP